MTYLAISLYVLGLFGGAAFIRRVVALGSEWIVVAIWPVVVLWAVISGLATPIVGKFRK